MKIISYLDKYSAEGTTQDLSGRNPVTETETELTLKLVNIEKLNKRKLKI
jgi:hypothetical protein